MHLSRKPWLHLLLPLLLPGRPQRPVSGPDNLKLRFSSCSAALSDLAVGLPLQNGTYAGQQCRHVLLQGRVICCCQVGQADQCLTLHITGLVGPQQGGHGPHQRRSNVSVALVQAGHSLATRHPHTCLAGQAGRAGQIRSDQISQDTAP